WWAWRRTTRREGCVSDDGASCPAWVPTRHAPDGARHPPRSGEGWVRASRWGALTKRAPIPHRLRGGWPRRQPGSGGERRCRMSAPGNPAPLAHIPGGRRMTAAAPLVRPATRADVEAFRGVAGMGPTIRGVAAEAGGEVVALGGLAFI